MKQTVAFNESLSNRFAQLISRPRWPERADYQGDYDAKDNVEKAVPSGLPRIGFAHKKDN